MIANKMKEKDENTPSIHTEGITDKDIQNINEGNASLSKLYIPNDGTAIEFPTPENLELFFDEEGKLMVRKKQDGEPAPNEETQCKPITYGDVLKELYLGKTAYWIYDQNIEFGKQTSYNFEDAVNCTSVAQAKRMVAFNKLQNIAKYLNKGWQPNFRDNSKKWSICKYICYGTQCTIETNGGNVYFKSADLADEAIRLMGEESLNDLFQTDW